jgi:peptidoglycan/LPS O-acetylase OafA/YrhL
MKAPSRQFFALSELGNHFPALHGVRVLGILSVLQFHVTVSLAEAHLLKDVNFARTSTSVFFGMDLFFILSGFLIGTMLLHEPTIAAPGQGAKRKGSLLRFYTRRSFRIFPLYYFTLTALALMFPLTAAQKATLPYEYAYLTNYRWLQRDTAVMMWGWSLCVEEHFYLAVPFLLAGLRYVRTHTGRLTLLAAMFLSALVIRLVIYRRHAGEWTHLTSLHAMYIPTHARFDVLVTGVFLAYVQKHFGDRIRAMLERARNRRAFFAFGLAAMIVLVWPFSMNVFFLTRVFAWGTVTSFMYVPWLLLLLNADGPLQRWFGQRSFLRWATLGYGIYLVHIPICEDLLIPFDKVLIERVGLSMALVWPLSVWLLFLVSAAVAYVLHLLVEKPALALRDRLT